MRYWVGSWLLLTALAQQVIHDERGNTVQGENNLWQGEQNLIKGASN
jgi:hypothetical protein